MLLKRCCTGSGLGPQGHLYRDAYETLRKRKGIIREI